VENDLHEDAELQNEIRCALDVLFHEHGHVEIPSQSSVKLWLYVAVGESRIFKSTFVSQLNGDPILYEDCLTRIRAGILYMKPKLLIVENHDTMLILIVIMECFFNTPKARIAGIHDRPQKISSN
jgi:hypothetical protein